MKISITDYGLGAGAVDWSDKELYSICGCCGARADKKNLLNDNRGIIVCDGDVTIPADPTYFVDRVQLGEESIQLKIRIAASEFVV